MGRAVFKDMDDLRAHAATGEPISISEDEFRRVEAQQQQQQLLSALERFRNGETEWDALKHMMGSHELPTLLSYIWHGLSEGQLIGAVGDAWVMCDAPEKHLRRREWLPIFRAAGYHDDDQKPQPPDRIQLWRGGIRRTGMAWTADTERAEWFHDRYQTDKVAKLWTVTIGPKRLLAHYHRRSEDEYVIDSTGVRPREVSG